METGTPSGSPESAPRRPRLPSGMRNTKPGWDEDPPPQAPVAPPDGSAPRRPRLPSGMRNTKPGWEETPEDTAPPPQQPPPPPGWYGPHPGMYQPPAPPAPPRPEEVAKITKAGRTALWLGAAALAIAIAYSALNVFVSALGIAAGIIAVLFGWRAQAAAQKARISVRGAVPGIAMGTVATVLSLIMTGTAIYTWDIKHTYEKCMSGANTVADQTACKDAYNRAFEKKFRMPEGSWNHAP